MSRVAVCEDDASLRSALRRTLHAAGHDVLVAHDGAEALGMFPPAEPDVVVLDIGLPDSDGRDVCLALRANGLTAPVLMLTARDRIHDKVSGFEAGADDYLTKPFELAELLLRIAALARRASARPGPSQPALRVDAATHSMAYGERRISLTPTEFRLLAKLLGEEGQVVRRSALVAAAWPMGAVVSDNTLDSYIRRIRRKMVDLAQADRCIETVRGVGYTWR